MRLFKIVLIAVLLATLIGSAQAVWLGPATRVLAQDGFDPEATPEEDTPRTAKITIAYTGHRWWLVRYSNNWIECSFTVEHEGLPNADDIAGNCTEALYDEWSNTEPCNYALVRSANECPGFYLHQRASEPGERQIEVTLPDPSAWLTVTNCNPEPPDRRCTTLPALLITGEEPLPNETIIAIHGVIGSTPFDCPGSQCRVPIPPTSTDGTLVEFWADSSFGDSTEHYTARVRMIPWGDFMNPEAPSKDPFRWYVDVLSSQWRDGKLATCSETWQVFPSLNGVPDWLQSPETAEELVTDTSYYYLAGSLITYGVVDASGCLDGGLQAPNIASACGVEAARPQLVEWQNRFDDEILSAASTTGVPALLLKNVFARESQIWPGIYTTYQEVGLGQLTDNGADTILLWNPDFFHQFCPLILANDYCSLGWGNLGEAEQAMLRGALVGHVNAACPECPAGIDLSEAETSVNVFAEGIIANCEQVGMIVRNITGMDPGRLSSYDDLWRFTLVNYNAGPGCLSDAMEAAWATSDRLDWAGVTSWLEPACQGAIGYVEDISSTLKILPTPTPWLPNDTNLPTPDMPRVVETPTPTPLPMDITPSPTVTPFGAPTATLPAYP